MIDRDDYKRLADELDDWHDCADGDVSAGNGHFRVVCENDSEQQRINLRATLREAAETLRAASVKAVEVKIDPDSPEEWDLEQRAFSAANDPAAPEHVKELVRDLWKAYCAAPTASVGAMWEAQEKAAHDAGRDTARSLLSIKNYTFSPDYIAMAIVQDALKAFSANQSDGGDLPSAETVEVKRWWLQKVHDDLSRVKLPSGVLGDYIFLLIPALKDILDSDVEALAATTAERPSTVTSEPEPSTSDAVSHESFVTTNPDGSVTLDAYAGKTREELKARCRELSMALNEWQFIAMETATAHGNCLSNVPEHARAKIANMIEAYRDDDEPILSDTPPAPTPSGARERIARLWHKAHNDWMRASRHGTQEEADSAAISILADALLPDAAAIYICYDGHGQYFISPERPASHVAIVYDEDAAEKVVDLFNDDTPDAAEIRAAAFEEAALELERSYPDHAWLNAACAAIRAAAIRAAGENTK